MYSWSPDQQFFDPSLQQWIAAKDITTQTTFLDAHLNHCACLVVETIHVPATKIYCISTTAPHTFFVTEQELLTHNAFLVVIGLAWLIREGLKFAGLTIGTTLLGSYIGVQLYNAQKQKAHQCNVSFHTTPCGSPCPDPDDDENKERVFNTISKSEFFKMVRKDYEHWRNNIYKRKHKARGIETQNILNGIHIMMLRHISKSKCHIGSINPKTLKLYKPPVYNRQFLEDKTMNYIKHCCELMDLFLTDIRVPIRHCPSYREYYILMLENGEKRGRLHAVQGIDYCPWCATKLPKSLRNEWFAALEKEYGLDDPDSKEQEKLVPQEFKTDEWWIKRGL